MPRSGHDHVAAMVEAWGSQRLSRDRRLSSSQFGDRGLVMAHGEHPTVWNSPFDANGSTSQSRVKAATLAVEMTIVGRMLCSHHLRLAAACQLSEQCAWRRKA